MVFLEALLKEARDALTLWAFLTIVVVVVLSKALPGARHIRLPGTLGLFGLHLVLLVVTAGMVAASSGEEATRDARIASHLLLVMSWVGAGGVFVFGVVMSRTRFQLARILQ